MADDLEKYGMKPRGELHPSFTAYLAASGVAAKDVTLSWRAAPSHGLLIPDRTEILLCTRPLTGDRHTDAGEVTSYVWHVPSLASLFRGTAKPPASQEGVQLYYTPFITHFETGVVQMAAGLDADPTDEDMERVYSQMRRRPDGKGLSVLQNAVWQCAAYSLAYHEIGAAEFEAVMRRLAISAATFRTHAVSRNYIVNVRYVLDGRSGTRGPH